jgi:cell division protein FtsZ
MLINITGGTDLSLHEVDKASQLITKEVDDESANIIFGAAVDSSMEGSIRVSIVATGIEGELW